MTSAEINAWINDVWITNESTYSNAVSIFDALDGGPLTPTASNHAPRPRCPPLAQLNITHLPRRTEQILQILA